jgi:hypothetical protein
MPRVRAADVGGHGLAGGHGFADSSHDCPSAVPACHARHSAPVELGLATARRKVTKIADNENLGGAGGQGFFSLR